jgi:ABC-type Na+ efflux pump permease subunit
MDGIKSEPLEIAPPWRVVFLILASIFLAGIVAAVISVTHSDNVENNLERARVEAEAVIAESADARARDSLQTVREGYNFKRDSMNLEWTKQKAKKKRGKR